MRLIVTTGNRAAADTVARATELAEELAAPFEPRSGRSIENLFEATAADTLLIVTRDRLLAQTAGGVQYAYHPNLAVVRAQNIALGKRDVFLDAAALAPGDWVLDCTLGFGCEAILAACEVGECGRVVGLESEPLLAVITRDGIREFAMRQSRLRAAMNRIEVVNRDYGAYLEGATAKSYDVVCFDPFFEERIRGSEKSVSPLYAFGNPAPLSPDAVLRARIVAEKRVVVKLSRFEELPMDLEPYVTDRLCGRKSDAVYYVLSTSPAPETASAAQ